MTAAISSALVDRLRQIVGSDRVLSAHAELLVYECDGFTIDCPPGYACRVMCTDVDSCDEGTVNCTAEYACTLVCDGYDGCGDLELNCGAGSCSIECGPDDASCQGTNVNCGAGACSAACDGGSTPTMSDCTSSCSCAEC